MKHANVALFVPHNGCPHRCSFCNQNSITGLQCQPTPQDVRDAVDTAVNTLGECTKNAEIAFFGGSFTAIDRQYMTKLLKAAYPYVKSGQFMGIRCSTRPDCIDRETLILLKKYGVTAVELGAQSMVDEVLAANERGHSAQDVRDASVLIKEYGFSLGLQMMTGLYKSSIQLDYDTADIIAGLKPDTVRIYPTITMKDTYLETLYKAGEYTPAALEETVTLCAGLLKFFEADGINVIRLGLHDSESLRRDMIAGPYHPAFSELCQSKNLLSDVFEQIKINKIKQGKILLSVHPKTVSKLCGQKRCNIAALEKAGFSVKILQNAEAAENRVIVME